MKERRSNEYLVKNAGAIWSIATKPPLQAYAFTVGPKARRSLERLIGTKECGWVFKDECRASINKRLRKALKPKLTKGQRADQIKVAHWIVEDWGGIKSGNRADIDTWIGKFGNFSSKSLGDFAQDKDRNRISSWSKILAFANPTNHAIYDSRVAASLNCCLANIKSKDRFYQPPSRNRLIQQVEADAKPQTYGYFDYLALLHTVIEHRRADSILEAEMILFANAEALVERRIAGCINKIGATHPNKP